MGGGEGPNKCEIASGATIIAVIKSAREDEVSGDKDKNDM